MVIFFLLMGFRENFLIGADLTRSIGGAGFWTEAAYVFAEQKDDYFRGIMGMDYSFTEKLYAFAEYHWNQAGSGDPKEYLSLLSKTAYIDGSVYLFGEHYLAPGVGHYGIFSGRRWREMVYPRIRDFIRRHAPSNGFFRGN